MSEDEVIADSDVKIEDLDANTWQNNPFAPNGSTFAQPSQTLPFHTNGGLDGAFDQQGPLQIAQASSSTQRVPIERVTKIEASSSAPAPSGPMSKNHVIPSRYASAPQSY